MRLAWNITILSFTCQVNYLTIIRDIALTLFAEAGSILEEMKIPF